MLHCIYYYCNVTMLQRCIAAMLQCCNVTLIHCCIGILIALLSYYIDKHQYIYNIDIIRIIVAMLQYCNVIMMHCCIIAMLHCCIDALFLFCWAVAAAGLQLPARSTGPEVITMQSNRNPRWQGIRLDSQSDSLRTHGIYGFIFITAI